MGQQQSALTEVVEQERRADEAEPVDLDRPLTEVAEVRVERFATGRNQKDRSENEKGAKAVVDEEVQRVERIDGDQNTGVLNDAANAEDGDGREPDERDGSEHRPDAGRAAALKEEQPDQNDDAGRRDVLAEDGIDHHQPFDRSEDRDGWGQNAIGIEKGCAEQAEDDDEPLRPSRHFGAHQRHQCQDAALAVVVRPDDVDVVLDGDDDHQGPENQRQHAKDIGGRHEHTVRAVEALTDRVEGTRSDIAVDDAQRREREHHQTLAPWRGVFRLPRELDRVSG